MDNIELELDGKDVGGKNPKNKVIVGKVYANWCGHCKNLKPEWNRMKTNIHKKKGKKHIVYAEVEENEIGTKLQNIEKTHNVKVNVTGYPTLFRIVGGKIEYYNGNRESRQMADWYLNGGSEEEHFDKQLNMQGGRHRYFTRRRNRYNYRRSRHHTYKYSTIRSSRKKKPSVGVFEFLFGK